ncbi:MAG: C10 family peptidase [Bacteroidales bacterium]|jgi:hypothetical protein|nr:C10 family peptidase [Bacteroidales bacterium]
MKKNLFILIFLVLKMIDFSLAQQVTLAEAKNAALSAIKTHSLQKEYALSSISRVHVLENKQQDTLLYEIIFSDNQAILLSGSKSCLPTLGYYKTGGSSIFSPEAKNIPCGLQAMIQDYGAQVAWAFANDTIPPYHYREWQDLQSYASTRSTASIVVNPLLSSEWGQWVSNDNGDCTAYNYYVTADDNSCNGCSTDKCPVGCVAVAMGQVMKYWNYPVYQSDKAYQYDWCNMPDRLDSYRTNYIRERNSIARLLKDCAESVNAIYCVGVTCQTSASLISARRALDNDFGYSDADWALRTSYTFTNWKNKIKNNLNRGIPVIYSSPGMNADGHAWVCDGYDSDDLFHFNWGNYGSYYGWFALNAIEYYDYSGRHHNYNLAQEAIFDIYPVLNNTQNYCNYYLPLWTHYYFYYNIAENTFPPPYLNVPKTFAVLESVHESIAQQLPAPATWHTIPAGGVSEYVAHKEIRLLPGFHAEAGSYFRAHIEPCMGCSEVQSSSMLNNPINEDDFSGIYDMLPPLKQGYSVAANHFQEEETENITLYPNPNNGSFTIETNFDPREVTTVQIYNSLGQLAYSQAGLPQAAITVPGMSKGLFVVKITTATNQFMHKMVVQ